MMSQISTSELSKHNKPQDAWILIEKTVWDVTDFAEQHPGGAEIIYQYIGHGEVLDFIA
jgi:L-lactate dehydrogenase (cytochrome)